MDGKRFGVGLAAGLMVALAVVGAAGGLGSNPVSVYLRPGSGGGTTVTVSQTTHYGPATTSVTAAMTTATAVTLTVTTYGGTTSQSGSSAATDGVTTASSTVSTATPVTTTTTPVPSQSEGSNSKSNTPAYSSGVYSIAHQSALSNAVVFVPVLVAFLLGAVLYRVSTKGRAGSEKD